MMFLLRNRATKRWFRGVYKLLSNKIKKELEKKLKGKKTFSNEELEEIRKMKWRLAYNLHRGGFCNESIAILEELCQIPIDTVEKCDEVSDYHLTAGKCCLEIFYESKSINTLRKSYEHYQTGIQLMKFDLFAMFKLPHILQEFGRVMEHYGSFEGALELYSKIMSNFPTFRGYFHVMYRVAIVGKYIGEMSGGTKGQEFNDQCIDILQFLLEALPAGINSIHIVLLYIHSLQLSSNPTNRFRANGLYQALYDTCAKSVPPVTQVSKYTDFRDWMDDPFVWKDLAEHACELQEPLIARDCYRNYVDRLNMRRIKKEMDTLTIDQLLKMACNCAEFQNFREAAEYGEMALKQNHFHKEVRKLLSYWDPSRKKELQREESAVEVIKMAWRLRWMAPGYRKRYNAIVLFELEEKYKTNRFDWDTRKQLAYFGRKKWRPKFVFENDCAKKIQKQFRHAKIIWAWQAAIRAKLTGQGSEAYRKFMKKPYDRSIRNEVRRIANHRMCSKKHVIRKLLPLLDTQDEAHRRIVRSYRSYKLRCSLLLLVSNRQKLMNEKLCVFCTLIQSIWRMKLGCIKANNIRKHNQNMLASATKIQRYWRERNKTFFHSVYRVIYQLRRKKENLKIFLHYMILFRYKQFLKRRMMHAKKTVAATRIQKCFRSYLLMNLINTFRNNMARRIQRMVRDALSSNFRNTTKFVLRQRHNFSFSQTADKILESLVQNPVSSSDTSYGPGCFYTPPGIRQSSPQFEKVLSQNTIYCRLNFSVPDCVMLSAVLRHVRCKTRRLIFHAVNAANPSYEFDLLPAIEQCKSLRTIMLLGGKWSTSFITSLLKIVQTGNPRIIHVYIEGTQTPVKALDGNTGSDLVLTASRDLLSDFFNYSIPGIQFLSLHHMQLKDYDMHLLAAGLKINTSIKSLCLSFNFIEDLGVQELFMAITENKKSAVTLLDMHKNLIVLNDDLRTKFDQFQAPNSVDKTLVIVLTMNPIMWSYQPPISHSSNIGLEVICTRVTLKNKFKTYKKNNKNNNNHNTTKAGTLRAEINEVASKNKILFSSSTSKLKIRTSKNIL